MPPSNRSAFHAPACKTFWNAQPGEANEGEAGATDLTGWLPARSPVLRPVGEGRAAGATPSPGTAPRIPAKSGGSYCADRRAVRAATPDGPYRGLT